MKKKHIPARGVQMTKEDKIYQVVITVIVSIVVLCCLIPFLYVVGMSFSSEGEMIERNYFIIIPHRPILSAYKRRCQTINSWHQNHCQQSALFLRIFD